VDIQNDGFQAYRASKTHDERRPKVSAQAETANLPRMWS